MSSEEIYLTAIFYPKPGKVDELLARVQEITKAVHATEPDVLFYYAFRAKGADGKDEVVFVEKYKNQAAIDAHVKTAHFQEFAQKAAELTEKPFDLKQGAFIAGFEQRA
ncbi:hypothetical protein VTN77DRAFT_7798 [Rasamsonia byssochlamydoides]|uniref:uncharacterized protein n=1 Tax=Rasamsonia byssochlamydoides TaxID=89139 RepID=UPI0037434439